MPSVKPPPGLARGHRLPAGCVGYWLFNEHAGDARDLSGARNHAERIGTPTASGSPYGPQFGGWSSSHYFTVPQATSLNLASRPCVTIMMDVRADLSPYAYYGVVSKTSSGSWEDGWGFMCLSSGGPIIAFFANKWFSQFASVAAPSAGYHVFTGTYDPDTKQVELWMDGVLRGSATQTHTLADVSCATRIGCINGSAGWPDPIVAMSVSSGTWPNIPQLHAEWLSGRFLAAEPPIWHLTQSQLSLPVMSHHYAQMGAF